MIDLRNSLETLRRRLEDSVSQFMASDQGQRLIAWYEQLSRRDRLALRGLCGFAAVVVLYSLLLQPLIGYSSRAQRRLLEEQELIAWLRANEPVAKAAAAASMAGRDQPVASLVNSSAKANELTIRRYEPAGDGSIRVWLEGAQFNSVVKWLYQLQSVHGIHAAEFSVERESEPGRVSARLTLEG
ncbi:MAG: type II secretion system protein M [Gammaproteobacteria bacterium]|nr:type II secretion system protein M [Gammaproteobacteria bacterium]